MTARVAPRVLARALTLAAVLWAAAILSAPFLRTILPRAAQAVYLASALICHQRPARSFHLAGTQMPVCGRCTGLYLSGAIGAAAAWAGFAWLPLRTRRILLLSAIPTVATLALEWSGAANPGNTLRALSALPLGAAAGWLFVRMLRVEEQPGTCAMIS